MDLKTLKKDIDKYRDRRTTIPLTLEQEEFIVLCRDHPLPISYTKMADLWVKVGWYRISKTTLRERCVNLFKDKKNITKIKKRLNK